jgi:phosphoribosylanthranilate isomerase
LILAGGLDSRSAEQAIQAVNPDVLDACSLLEKSPGIKDPEKVARFIAATHAERIRIAQKRAE